jgi:hypothetical protein
VDVTEVEVEILQGIWVSRYYVLPLYIQGQLKCVHSRVLTYCGYSIICGILQGGPDLDMLAV